MWRTILIYGLLAGAIIISLGAVAFKWLDLSTTAYGEIVGYIIMLLGLALVYQGVKRYREEQRPPELTFGTALKVGLGIATVASLIYVVSWMLSFYLGSGAEIMEGYFVMEVERIKNSGLATEAIAIKLDELEQMRHNYMKPHNMAMITLVEILPVGLIVSLLTAWLLRSR